MASSRPKGYMDDWTPADKTVRLLANVNQVLRDQSAYLPLTARQVFYMLVGGYGYDKTEQAYARLCEAMVKARRAGIIRWGAIRDDGTVTHHAGGYDEPRDFWRTQLSFAQSYWRDRAAGQRYRIEVWCEAAGMAPQIARAIRPYGVPTYSTGGFSSVTVTKEIADRVCEDPDTPMIFMHVGDFDPSGESIFTSMSQDVGAFVVGDLGGRWQPDTGEVEDVFLPRRVALTADQVNDYGIQTAPPKASDSRSANWLGETAQLEAVPPGTLNQLLVDAIEDEYDLDLWTSIVAEERTERAAVVAEVERNIREREE